MDNAIGLDDPKWRMAIAARQHVVSVRCKKSRDHDGALCSGYLPHTVHFIIVKSVQRNSGGAVYAGNPTDLRELRSSIVTEFSRSDDLFL